jgi:hypothetical protein
MKEKNKLINIIGLIIGNKLMIYKQNKFNVVRTTITKKNDVVILLLSLVHYA